MQLVLLIIVGVSLITGVAIGTIMANEGEAPRIVRDMAAFALMGFVLIVAPMAVATFSSYWFFKLTNGH